MMSSNYETESDSLLRRDPNTQPTMQLDWELEEIVSQFESAWMENGSADVARFLPAADHARFDTLAMELMRVDAELATRAGSTRDLNFYTELLPQVLAVESNRQQLAFELSRLSGPAAVEAAYPPVGAVVAGFELLSLLGFGAFSRVYLASENELSRRLVILKFSTRFPGEAGTLARLQHKNIVPIYSWHRADKFHIVCMPYLGATTLWDFLKNYSSVGCSPDLAFKTPALGQAIVSTVHQRLSQTMSDIATARPTSTIESIAPVHEVVKKSKESTETTSPPLLQQVDRDSSVSDTQAKSDLPTALSTTGLSREIPKLLERQHSAETIAWIGRELADGLMHAHDRGVLHRDIKPANILLADDGTPMLLDFNLSTHSGPNESGAEASDVGGTPRYMAPEQLLSVTNDGVRVDAQADLYSLGVVLYELAVGRAPFAENFGKWQLAIPQMIEQRKQWSATSVNWPKHLSPSLIEIIAKLMAFESSDRYASARDVYEDFERQLQNLPLKHARNRSVRERVQKWSKRHPKLSSAAVVGSLLGGLLILAATLLIFRQSEIRQLASVQWLNELEKVQLPAQAILGQASLPIDQIEEMVTTSAKILGDEKRYTAQTALLSDADRAKAKQLVGQLLTFRARGKCRLAEFARDPLQRTAYLQSALLDAQCAPELLTVGKSSNEQLARAIRELLKPPASEDATDYTTDQETHLPDIAPEIIEQTQQLLGVDAANPWYWWVLGHKQFVSGDPDGALASAQVARQLDPQFPWSHYLIALIHLDTKRFAAAEVELTKLVDDFDLNSTELFMNRAIARLAIGRAREAMQDLRGIEDEADRFPRIYFLREQALRMLGDAKAANEQLRLGTLTEPTEGHGFIARADAKLRSNPPDPHGALSDYERASTMLPYNATCYENQAFILSELLHDNAKAIEVLTRGIARLPQQASLLGSRATLLGRQKDLAAARKDVDAALQLDRSAILCYQAASALLLASNSANDHDLALELLKEALRKDPALKKSMETDRDLSPIRETEPFIAALNAATVLQ